MRSVAWESSHAALRRLRARSRWRSASSKRPSCPSAGWSASPCATPARSCWTAGRPERVRRARRGDGHPVPAPVGEPPGRLLLRAGRARRAAAAGPAARPLRRARTARSTACIAASAPLGGGFAGRRRRHTRASAPCWTSPRTRSSSRPSRSAHEVQLEAALTAERLTITTRSAPRAAYRCRSASASTPTCGCPARTAPAGGSRSRRGGICCSTTAACRPARREEQPATAVRAGGPPLRRRLRPAARTAPRSRCPAVGGRSPSRSSAATRSGRSSRPRGRSFICFEPMTAPTNALRSGVGAASRRPRRGVHRGLLDRGAQRVHPEGVMTGAGPWADDGRMTTAARSRPGATASGAASEQPADVFVVFGITGDLAKVMTLHSLYRLEARGLLTCPIVGVAVDDWTVDDLRERAREAIVASRRDARPGGLRPLRRPPLLPGGRLRGPGDLRAPRGAPEGRPQPGLLPRDPAVPVRRRGEGPRRRGPDRARPRRRREAVRPRPRVRPRARGGDARVPRRAPALPDRPLPREAGPRGAPLPAVRERDPRAGLAPQLRRERPDHDGRELRRRGPRALLRPGRRAARRRGQPPDAGRRGGGDGGAGGARSRRRSRTRCSPSSTRCRRPTRRTTCAASTTATARSTASPRTRRPRPTPRCGWRSTTGAGRACRSSSAPASTCRSPRPSCGSCSSARRGWASTAAAAGARARPARRQARPLDRRAPAARGAARRARGAASRSASTWSSAARAATARRRTRCCCTPRCRATARASSARTASRRRGASCSRWSTRRRRSTRTPRDRGDRPQADRLLAGHGRWHEPWMSS